MCSPGVIFTLEKKIDILKRGSEATEGGRVWGGPPSHGRDFLHFGTLNCAILCIPEGEIWA